MVQESSQGQDWTAKGKLRIALEIRVNQISVESHNLRIKFKEEDNGIECRVTALPKAASLRAKYDQSWVSWMMKNLVAEQKVFLL